MMCDNLDLHQNPSAPTYQSWHPTMMIKKFDIKQISSGAARPRRSENSALHLGTIPYKRAVRYGR